MKRIKKIQKNICSKSIIKPELAVVHGFKKDGELYFVATDGYKLVEIKAYFLINAFDNLPDKFTIEKNDILALRNFDKMQLLELDGENLYYRTFDKDFKEVQYGIFRIHTHLDFVSYEKLFAETTEQISESINFNYKNINAIGELLSDDFDTIKLELGGGKLQIEAKHGRGLVMPVSINRK